jgi:hypothetical protein
MRSSTRRIVVVAALIAVFAAVRVWSMTRAPDAPGGSAEKDAAR